MSGGGFAAASDPRIVVNDEKVLRDPTSSKRISLRRDMAIGTLDGEDAELFGRPTEIAVDRNGNIYVLDHGYHRIQKYSDEGQYLMTVGRQGEGPGEYAMPTAIAVDDQNRLYVGGFGSRISVYDDSGSHVTSFKHEYPGNVVRSMGVDSSNNIYVVCIDILNQQMIHKYDSNGSLVLSFCDSYAVGLQVDTRIENIYAAGSIYIDQADNIFYTQEAPYELRKYAPNGALLMKVYRENSFLPAPPDLDVGKTNRVVVTATTISTAVIAFDDGAFVNVVKKPGIDDKAELFLDYFSPKGKLLAHLNMKRDIDIRCRDMDGRLYATDMEDYPAVVRYIMSIE